MSPLILILAAAFSLAAPPDWKKDMIGEPEHAKAAPAAPAPAATPAAAPDPTETATVVGRNIGAALGDRVAFTLAEDAQATRAAIRELADAVKKLTEAPPRLATCPCGAKCPGPGACDCGCGEAKRKAPAPAAAPAPVPASSPAAAPARALPVRQVATPARKISILEAQQQGYAYGRDRTGKGWYGATQADVDAHIRKVNAEAPVAAPVAVAAPVYTAPPPPVYYDAPPVMSYTMPSAVISAMPSFGGGGNWSGGGSSCASGMGGCGSVRGFFR